MQHFYEYGRCLKNLHHFIVKQSFLQKDTMGKITDGCKIQLCVANKTLFNE